jgi:hypothetical protein
LEVWNGGYVGAHPPSPHVAKTYNVDVPKSNTTIFWTPILEWYVVKCGFKNGHQRDMCLKEIQGLHAQNMIIILRSIVNMIGQCPNPKSQVT